MTADVTGDNLVNLEGLNGPCTFMNGDDGMEPRDDVRPFSPAVEEHPDGSSDGDSEDETEGYYTSRVRGSDDVAMPDDDDDLDADETTLRLECPPGYAFSQSASPALDTFLLKRHIVLRRGVGWVKGFLTRRAQAWTRQDCDYMVLGIRMGLSAPMEDRPHAGFSGTSELTTKRMRCRYRSNVE